MKNIKLYVYLLPLLLFTGCSWLEYFVVRNFSKENIYVVYNINKPQQSNFPIFETSPEFYQLNKNGKIDWNNPITIKDSDNNPEIISVIMPPNSIMIFGRLNNDNYKGYNQKFINGREFNLDFMEIEVNLEVNHISKETFDANFSNQKGFITYDIK